MKKYFAIMAILTLLIAMSGIAWGLTAGDIAILGVNTDETKSMVFVALADIPANTTISFTDNAWNATTVAWRTGEGTIQWSHTSTVSAGTVITITDLSNNPYTVDIGSITYVSGFNLSTSGDQVLAYEGTTTPTTNDAATWLYGFSTESFSWGDNSNTSDIPTALTNYSVAMTSSTTETDNAYFANGSSAQSSISVSGTKSELLALFIDNSKYYQNNTGPLTFPTYTILSSEPTTQASAINFTDVGTNGMTINWTSGNGSNRIVLVKAGDVVDSPPVDGTSYTASTTFGSGSEIGDGNFVVYNGTGSSVAITGLSAVTTYHVAIVEFNGTSGSENYYLDTPATGNQATSAGSTPLITVSTSTLAEFAYAIGYGPSSEKSFTVAGLNLVANISIAAPTNYEISTGTGGSFSATNPITLTQSGGSVEETTIYVRLKAGLAINSYNDEVITCSSTDADNKTVTCSGSVTRPADPDVQMSDRTATSISFSWTEQENDVMLFYNTVNEIGTPVDGNSYSVSQAIPGGGTVLYNGGDQTSYTKSDLTPNTTYYWGIYSVDGSNIYSSGIKGPCETLKAEPSNHVADFILSNVTYSSITLTWDDNDGTYAADTFLVVLETTADFAPVDGSNDMTGITSGEYTKYVNHGVQTVTFTGLEEDTEYTARIWPISNIQRATSDWDYKTDGEVPQVIQTTQTMPSLPLVEDFDYGTGSLLVNNRWEAHSGAGTQSIDVTNGLSFTGYASSGIGGAANVDNNGEDVSLVFQSVTSGTVYMACIIKTESSNSAGYFLHFGETVSSWDYFSKVWVNATGDGIGIGGSAPSSYIPITAQTPTLVVVKYDFSTKLSELFVFDTFPNSEPETADASFSELSELDSLSKVCLRQYNAAQRIIVDGIRIANDWYNAVTPTAAASVTHAFGTGLASQAFDGTSVAVVCTVSTGANVTVNKYNSGPSNVSFSGDAPTYVSNYRWVINAGNLAFSNGTIKIAVAGLTGIGDPSTVSIYKRDNPGSGAFSQLETNFTDGVNLTASISSFSEFILGSDEGDNSLPVELTDFTAESRSGGVLLTWKTESETENLGFIVQRRLRVAPEGVPDGTSCEFRVDNGWEEIASYTTSDALAGHGSTSEAHEYAYTDAAVVPGTTYLYRLGDVDYSGVVKWHKDVEVTIPQNALSIPDKFSLGAIYPNPSNAMFTIPFGLPEAQLVKIAIYDISGKLVKLVTNQVYQAGAYHLPTEAGNLSSGLYLVRILAGNHFATQKLLLTK